MDFIIDFDEASELWRKNKRSLGNGMYMYICTYVDKKGKQCKRQTVSQTSCTYCTKHINRKIIV
jgi:hypothetical protein